MKIKMNERKRLINDHMQDQALNEKHLQIELSKLNRNKKLSNIRHRNLSGSMAHGSNVKSNNILSQTADGLSQHASSLCSSTLANSNLCATRYGTIQTSGSTFKQTVLVESRYKRTYYSRKQFFMACMSIILFLLAMTITLIFGLPRLKAKCEQYFAAQFYNSSLTETVHSKFTVLISGNEYAHCADTGRDVLIRKGSAIDAALACLFCLTISSPHLVGLDSGFRAMFYLNKSMYAIQVAEQMYPLEKNKSLAFPLLPIAAEQLHQQFGKISWSSILTPAIWFAKNGIPISKQLAAELGHNQVKLEGKHLKKLNQLFTRSTNNTKRLLKDGEMYKNVLLASTYKLLSENGSLALFNHEFFDEINHFLNTTITWQQIQSFITKNQFVQIDEALKLSLLDNTVQMYSGGKNNISNDAIILAHMFRILEKLTLNELDSDFKNCNNNGSLKENAKQYRYLLDSLYFGSKSVTDAKQANILHQDYIDKIAKAILDNLKDNFYQIIDNEKLRECEQSCNANNNIEIIVYDTNSDQVIALTTTKRNMLFQGEEKFISNKSGLVLDINQNLNFNTNNHPVQWPVMIMANKDDHVDLVLGTVGGRGFMQPLSATLQVMNKILLNCQTLKASIDSSRLFYHFNTNTFLYEPQFPQAYIDLLNEMFAGGNKLKQTCQQNIWSNSAVYAIMKRRTNSNIKSNTKEFGIDNQQLISMIDFRLDGFISGQ